MQKKRLNPWSMVAALCAVGICPLFSVASILAGFRALVEIKARGDTRGVRLAWVSILVGATITGLWGGGMLWWNINVRSMMKQGPVHAIMQGQAGDVDAFLEIFSTSNTKESASEFLHVVSAKYGSLKSGHQDQDTNESLVDTDNLYMGNIPLEAMLPYVLAFSDGKMLKLTAQYELFTSVEKGRKFTNRFAWIRIHDEKEGFLVYPAHAVEDSAQHGE